MIEILTLMMRIEALKRTARTGWNKKPEPGDTFQARTVPNAESVADHSWSLAMFAFMIATKLGLNVTKMVTMALLHDLAECITGDGVTATLPHEERRRRRAEKRILEDAAMHELFQEHREFGAECYALWVEYENGTSEEARVLADLDKLECAMQAVCYAQQGHESRPEEFLAFTRSNITHPGLLEILVVLEERTKSL